MLAEGGLKNVAVDLFDGKLILSPTITFITQNLLLKKNFFSIIINEFQYECKNINSQLTILNLAPHYKYCKVQKYAVQALWNK